MKMKECIHYQDNLHDYVDGALGSVEAIQLTAHLSECDACKEELEGIERLRTMLRTAEVPDSEEARTRVMRCFRVATQTDKPRRVPLLRRWQLGVAACAMAAAILVFAMPSLPTKEVDDPAQPTKRVSQLPTSSELDQLTLLHSESSGGMPLAGSEHLLDAASDARSRISIAIAP
jgi:anti-sigma factor RsiW